MWRNDFRLRDLLFFQKVSSFLEQFHDLPDDVILVRLPGVLFWWRTCGLTRATWGFSMASFGGQGLREVRLWSPPADQPQVCLLSGE